MIARPTEAPASVGAFTDQEKGMHPHKLKLLVFTLAGALSTAAMAQAPTPARPPANPSTGTGATPGGIPPATTAPGAASNIGSPATPTPPAGGNPAPGNRATLDFAAVDSDGDGYISRAEASRASLGGQFTVLDKNNDGRLDPSEFAAHRPENVRIPDTQPGTASSTTGTMSRR